MPIGHKIRYAGVNHSSLSFSSSAMEHKTMPNIWPAATYLSTAGINRWQDQWMQILGIRHLEKNWFICSIFFPALAENTGRIFTVKATANQARRDMWVPSPCSDKRFFNQKKRSRGAFLVDDFYNESKFYRYGTNKVDALCVGHFTQVSQYICSQ